jgi:hypothetical protein
MTFNTSILATEKMSFSELSAFMDKHPDIKVVIIDTWQKFAGVHDGNDYAENVGVASALKAIADKHGAAIIVITHKRKNNSEGGDHLNETLGSIGLVATADTTWTLERKRGAKEAKLFVSGRNTEDHAYSLEWDKDICSWAITGQGNIEPAIPEGQQQIIDLLESGAKPMGTMDIAKALNKDKGWTSRTAKVLNEAGHIQGKWAGRRWIWAANAVDLGTFPIGEVNKSTPMEPETAITGEPAGAPELEIY